MDLKAMLAKCERDQWKPDDLDWSVEPRCMQRDEEMAIVQCFTDMAGIELLAAALFEEQARRAECPTLRRIFESFVQDEQRHSEVALRLARHYDVHRYKHYRQNADLTRFTPHFVHAIRHVSAEVANAYITCGELLLDVALLRSLNDYVHDEMSERAMALINRDESRHIAVDFHMVEYYASPDYQRWLQKQPKPGPAEVARSLWAISNFVYYAGPFFKGVLFEPLARVDPSGQRMREAFKRAQLLAGRPRVKDRPFWKTYFLSRRVFTDPHLGRLLSMPVKRLAGLPDALLTHLYERHEMYSARRMSLQELVEHEPKMRTAS